MRIEATYEVLYLYRNQFIIAINIDTYCNNRNIYIYPRSPDIQQERKKTFIIVNIGNHLINNYNNIIIILI